MADERPKGSIIYEVLIVILAAMLVFSIVYPKQLSDQEQRNTQICRDRMSSIFDAELQYLKYNNTYTDTLDKVIDFIRNDERYATYVDSVIKGGLDSVITKLNEFKTTEEFILSAIPQAVDTTMIDSLSKMQVNIKFEVRELAAYVEFIHDKMKDLPNMPLETLTEAFLTVDSKKFTVDMDIVKNTVENGLLRDAEVAAREALSTIDRVKSQFETVLNRLPQYKGVGLDSLRQCPTVYRPYNLVHVDTSVIKYINIYCSIDSTDVEAIESSFLKSKIGGLTIQNHGKIEKGEKSWEEGT